MGITSNSNFIGFNEYISQSKQNGFRDVDDTPLYAHPIDGWIVSALNTLSIKNSIEGVIDTLVSIQMEKQLASGIFLDNDSFPEIFEVLSKCAKKLQVPLPHSIVTNEIGTFNAQTSGTDNYAIIFVSSGISKFYTNDEIAFVIGHECGHIAASHMPYHTLISSISTGLINLIPGGGIIQAGLSVPLNAWSRRSEITADRAGLLCCGDIKIAEKSLLKLSVGFGDPEKVNIDDFLAKSKETQKYHSTTGKLGELLLSHPLIPKRIEAIRLFAHSQLYYSLTKNPVPRDVKLLTNDELNRRVEHIIKEI